jgi:hypothetical protein
MIACVGFARSPPPRPSDVARWERLGRRRCQASRQRRHWTPQALAMWKRAPPEIEPRRRENRPTAGYRREHDGRVSSNKGSAQKLISSSAASEPTGTS